jgi:alkylation response protein AidB-like acyl-CoA dehydrogenase
MLLSCERAERTPTGVFGSLTASLEWSQEDCARRVAGDPGALRSFGAAIHAAMLAGAMDRVFEMSLQFCNDRIQFGKPLGKFQAIQHQLSVMAEQVAACGIAAESAFQSKGRSPHPLAAAIAKARCSEAAAFVANVGHALHGAIGVTAEYDLQLLTRRLHEWRVAHGSETHWHAYIGAQVLASGGSMSDFVREVWEQP